jgi:hypothetical protein
VKLENYPYDLELSSNWWGSTDRSVINNAIVDGKTQPGTGATSITPILESESEYLATAVPPATLLVSPSGHSAEVGLGPHTLTAFNVRSSQAGDILAATVDWGDGTPVANALIVQATGDIEVTHTFTVTGTFEGFLTITSEGGGLVVVPFTLVVSD